MNWKHILSGAITGVAAAAYVDYLAFRSWKSFDDFRRYDWGIAVWRWIQGAVIGGLTAAGFGA